MTDYTSRLREALASKLADARSLAALAADLFHVPVADALLVCEYVGPE